MKSYLNDRLCKGFPPQRINVAGSFTRNALVSRMMMDRRRVRFVCAPTYMGKTTLVYTYAQIVFSFENVLWLDASHPCVLRDLDDGSLSSKLCQVLDSGGLVVFEDVPWFGSVRKQRFAAVCEDLLSRNYEVVVTAIPECDPFSGDWGECIALSSQDLLFSDAEIEEMRMCGLLPPHLRTSRAKVNRIPGIRDRSTGTMERFLAAQLAESRSAFESALTIALVLMGCGSLNELSDVMGLPVEMDDLRVADLRPYVELRDSRNRFSAEGFSVNDVLRASQPYSKSVCQELSGSDFESFLCRVADRLLAQGQADRATNLVIGGCSPSTRAVWLMHCSDSMLQEGNALSVALVYRSLGSASSARHHHLVYANGYALCLLGSRQTGVEKLLSVARRRDAPAIDRMRAASIAALHSDCEPAHLSLGDSFGACCLQASDTRDVSSPLELLWNALLEGDSGLEQLYAMNPGNGEREDWLLACACCLRGIGRSLPSGHSESVKRRLLGAMVARIAEEVQACVNEGFLGMAIVFAVREIDALGRGKIGWTNSCRLYLTRAESRLRSQRSAFEKLCDVGPQPAAESSGAVLAWKGQGNSRGAIRSVPMLEVRVFGGFEVTIGGNPADTEKLSRLKVRALLALLVLDAGKDVSCEHLGLLLWPDSVPEKARRNFYSIYSMLNRALVTPEGEYPYLTRSQGVCRLNTANLRSDASGLLETCNQMRFGKPASKDAYMLLEQLRSYYRGELLPGEATVPAIAAARSHWRNRVVDSVLYAARDLQSRAELPAALEYAKAALVFDAYREDCYELLMVLQMTCGQRTAAIETFFAYNRMSHELGLGASARMVDLYNCIINDEQVSEVILSRESVFA